MKVTIELEYEQITSIFLKELRELEKQFVKDIDGKARVFSMDPKEDSKEITKHLDAIRLIRNFYGDK